MLKPTGASSRVTVTTSTTTSSWMGGLLPALLWVSSLLVLLPRGTSSFTPRTPSPRHSATQLQGANAEQPSTEGLDFSDTPMLCGQTVFSTFDPSVGYLLTDLLPVASAKKCQIYEAYRHNTPPEHNVPLVCKLSGNLRGMEWEAEAYQMLDARLSPEERSGFVQVYDMIAPSEATQHRAALIMEKGLDNLRFQIRNNSAYRGEKLRQAMQTIIYIVHVLHSHGLVWTELKAENFVMTNTTNTNSNPESSNQMFYFGIKGIDLESVIPAHDWLRVYTAEACPPEFPVEELYKSLPRMRVDPSFDMWGLGLVLYEIATGKPFYAAGLTDLEYIRSQLANPEAALARAHQKLLSIPPQPRAMIQRCMSINPADRPTCLDLLQDPYFELGQSVEQLRTSTSSSTVPPQQ